MDLVITDSTCTYIVQRTSTTTKHAMTMVAQEKTRSDIKQTPDDDFIPLAIETYGCFHSHFDSFFITCAQTIIVHHQRSSTVPLMLISHY
jgi:hypothetical protein